MMGQDQEQIYLWGLIIRKLQMRHINGSQSMLHHEKVRVLTRSGDVIVVLSGHASITEWCCLTKKKRGKPPSIGHDNDLVVWKNY
jgi:hypothetical protein